MEVTPRYKLLTLLIWLTLLTWFKVLTLLTLFTMSTLLQLLYTASTLACVLIHYIYIVMKRYWSGLVQN